MTVPERTIVGTAKIEYWPHNGQAKHVIVVREHVLRPHDGKVICFACLTRADAEERIDDFAFCWGMNWNETLQVLRP